MAADIESIIDWTSAEVIATSIDRSLSDIVLAHRLGLVSESVCHQVVEKLRRSLPLLLRKRSEKTYSCRRTFESCQNHFTAIHGSHSITVAKRWQTVFSEHASSVLVA